jgi:hypothetical protein
MVMGTDMCAPGQKRWSREAIENTGTRIVPVTSADEFMGRLEVTPHLLT